MFTNSFLRNALPQQQRSSFQQLPFVGVGRFCHSFRLPEFRGSCCQVVRFARVAACWVHLLHDRRGWFK